MCSWRLIIYLFVHWFYYMNKSKHWLWNYHTTYSSNSDGNTVYRTLYQTTKISIFFPVGSARPHCISFISPHFWKPLMSSTHLNTMDTVLCNDNYYRTKGHIKQFFFHDLNTVKIFRNGSLRSSVAFRYKYRGEGNWIISK